MPRPLIGVTLDAEKPGGYSKFPWYALRQNYLDAIDAAGGLPVALPPPPGPGGAALSRRGGARWGGAAAPAGPGRRLSRADRCAGRDRRRLRRRSFLLWRRRPARDRDH